MSTPNKDHACLTETENKALREPGSLSLEERTALLGAIENELHHLENNEGEVHLTGRKTRTDLLVSLVMILQFYR